MLINPYANPPAAIPGTRLLETTLGIIGMQVQDPQDTRRSWEVQSLYLPVRGRVLGGIRAKLVDQKNFRTFCNQRDLEFLLGIAKPGNICPWGNTTYAAPGDREWVGFCCDDDDLLDDLQEQEMFLRGQLPNGLLYQWLEMERRVHLGHQQDYEEVYYVLQDFDPETGMFPDTRFETIEQRWVRSERRRVQWERS